MCVSMCGYTVNVWVPNSGAMTISLHVISNGLYNVYCVAILIKNQHSEPFLFRSKSLTGNSTGEQKKNRKEVNIRVYDCSSFDI